MRASTFHAVLPRFVPLLISGSLLLATDSARAAPKTSAKARAQISLEEVSVMLASSEEDEVRTALETAATLPPRDVIAMLDERVRAGLSRVLLDVAVDSLLLLDDKTSTPLLLELAHHRRPEVRVRALEVLGHLETPDAEAALTRALGDLSADVRKAASTALAEKGTRASVGPLTRAFELGDESAGRALGRLAKVEEVARLLEYQGTLPIVTVTPLVEALLARRDVPEADKLRAVEKLSSLGGEEANASLETLLSTLPSEAPARLRRALTEAVEKGKNE